MSSSQLDASAGMNGSSVGDLTCEEDLSGSLCVDKNKIFSRKDVYDHVAFYLHEQGKSIYIDFDSNHSTRRRVVYRCEGSKEGGLCEFEVHATETEKKGNPGWFISFVHLGHGVCEHMSSTLSFVQLTRIP